MTGPTDGPAAPAPGLSPRALRMARQAEVRRRGGWREPDPTVPEVDRLLRHGDVRAVLADEAAFGPCLHWALREIVSLNPSAAVHLDHLYRNAQAHQMISRSGPAHREVRALFSRSFTPRRLRAVRPFITDLATRAVDALRPGDDLVSRFAAEIPAVVICEVLGVPPADRHRFLRWVHLVADVLSFERILVLTDAEVAALADAWQDLLDYAAGLVADRRRHPRDDLISQVAGAPDRPSDEVLVENVAGLLFAGNESTQRAIAQMVLVLADHPEVWDRVAADPGHAEAVVEEVLRDAPMADGVLRRVTGDVTYRDAEWRGGQVLAASIESANHDEAVFGPSARRFDPERHDARDHLTFGHGAHHCIGAGLARAELQECLRVLTATMTCPQVLGEVTMATGGFIGPARLPITFTRR